MVVAKKKSTSKKSIATAKREAKATKQLADFEKTNSEKAVP